MAVKTPAPQRQANRRKLAKKGNALPDGSFPVPDTAYLKKAIRAVGRAAPGKRPALARLIRKRAAQLGPAGKRVLKGSWADNKQSTTAMANALRAQLIECGYTPTEATLELTLTIPRLLEFAKSWDPDNDGDNDAAAKGDTDHDFAGACPKCASLVKKMRAKNMPVAAIKNAVKRAHAMHGSKAAKAA